METLETLKNNYAQEQGYEDWEELRRELYGDMPKLRIEEYYDEICIRAQKAALKKVKERLERKIELTSEMGMERENWAFSQSYRIITNPENLIR